MKILQHNNLLFREQAKIGRYSLPITCRYSSVQWQSYRRRLACCMLVVLVLSQAKAAFAGGLFEAEDASITSGGIKTHAEASGGLYVDGNGGFNLTWTPDLEGGDVELIFNIKVPNLTRSMGVYLNGSKVGTVTSSSTSWEELSLLASAVSGTNTLELRDSEGTAEPDVDYVFISKVTTFNVQAEYMALSSYSVISNEFAANSQFIEVTGGLGATGTATQVFTGDADEYYIDTAFFDETDGVGTYELRIDGVPVDTWLADGTFGTAGVSVESLTTHRSPIVQLQTNSVIELTAIRGGAEYGRVDEMTFTRVEQFLSEAEDMTLDGYGIETNAAASGGYLVRLQGTGGSVSETLIALVAGVYDLTIGYFDETDGEAAFKVYVNDQLVDSWLADRMLGSSEPEAVNRLERTTRNLYLRHGDLLEITGIQDGGEPCRIDGYDLKTADVSSAVSMDWNSDGTIESLILNGSEQLDPQTSEAVILRVFDGYSVDTLEQNAAVQDGSLLIVHESELDYARFYFRMDAYEHHLMLRLIGFDGIPRVDPSLNIRMEIPYLSKIGYQLMDSSVVAESSGGVLELDWNQLAQRDLLAGGQIALYATADTSAALDEIAQVHTANGNLDDYYSWIGGYPIIGTDADLFADPDGDGLNNLTEYALGGLPNLGNDAVLPVIGNTGSDLEVNYNRRLDAEARGLTYTMLRSDELVNSSSWSTNGVEETGSVVMDADFETVTNRVNTIDSSNGFMRLDIELEK